MNHAFSKIWIVVVSVILIAGGFFVWQYFGAPKEEVKIPEEKTSEQVNQDETADWKTYRNEEYGFEIKYSREWEILHEGYYKTEIPYEVSFAPKDLEGSYAAPIAILIHTESIENVSKGGGYEELKSEKEVVVDNIKSKEQTRIGPEGEFVAVFVPKAGELTYQLRYNNSQFGNIFNQMLSTFKFLQ